MLHTYLIGKQQMLDDDGNSMRLQYYLVEDLRSLPANAHLYGIQIVKKLDKDGKVYIEKETTPALSYSKEWVEQVILRLIKGNVTPMGLLEVVDDLVSESVTA